MERVLYALGLIFGSLILLITVASYETGGFIERAVIACVVFVTLGCLAGLIIPRLPAPDKDHK